MRKRGILFVLIVALFVLLISACNHSIFDYSTNNNNKETRNTENPSIEALKTPTVNNPAPIETMAPSRDGNSIESAVELVVNKPTTGALTSYSDKDYYSFELDKKGTVVIEMQIPFWDGTSFTRDWELTLFEAVGTNNELLSYMFSGRKAGDFASGYMDKQESGLIGLDAGKYYIRISPYDFSADNYILTVKYTATTNCEAEPNNNASQASPMTINTPYIGALQSYADKDFYSFTLEKKGTVIFEMQIPFEDGSSFTRDWELTVFDAGDTNNELMSHTFSGRKAGDFSGGSMDRRESQLIGLSAGTYFVRIVPGDHTSKEYILTVRYTETDCCETEPNNNASQASKLTINTPYIGALQSNSDKDFYLFTLGKKSTVVFEMQIPFDDGSHWYTNDWEVAVFDGETNVELMHQTFNCRGAGDFSSGGMDRQESKAITLEAGTYYLRIKPDYDYSSDKYVIKVICQ